jgi:leucine dehydrogenase
MTEILHWQDSASGLKAFCVIDSEVLGPAAGGVRTHTYSDENAALADARRLAKTMTLKCALAGLPNGGAKVVVMDHVGLDRPKAFKRIGQEVHKLAGRLHVAGDLGTRAEDVATLATQTPYAHAGTDELGHAVGKSVLSCLRGALDGRDPRGLSALVQGCGDMGRAVAQSFAAAGLKLHLVDLDPERARALADELNAQVAKAGQEAELEVDVFAPCARGDVVTEAFAEKLKARIICGAANHIFASDEAERIFVNKGAIAVPDVLASAGAVIWGLAPLAHPTLDQEELIEGLANTTQMVLQKAKERANLPSEVAEAKAKVHLQSHCP